LQLNTITILNLYGGPVSYDVLNTLIKYGDGWKALRFIAQESTLLGYAQPPGFHDAHYIERYQRKPEPAHWLSVMERRDGIETEPAVLIYRSTLPGVVGSVMDEATRIRFMQMPPKKGQAAAFAEQEYAPIMSPVQKTKGLMVVVRRGKGVDYQERKQSPYLPEIGDIRQDCPRMTWAEIRKKHIAWDDGDDSDVNDEPDDGPKREDVYRHVDEYEWTPLNSSADG
jgi:hypothetical protein